MRNTDIELWVADVARHTRPAAIHWCDGSREEADELTKRMLATGALERLDSGRPCLGSTTLCVLRRRALAGRKEPRGER